MCSRDDSPSRYREHSTGTIVIDGTIGALATGNILSWTLTLAGGGNSYTLEGPLSGNNSVLTVYLGGLSASRDRRRTAADKVSDAFWF